MSLDRWVVVLGCGVMLAACSRNPDPIALRPTPSDQYSMLPDTLVCVVDRTTTRGLRNLAAKKRENEVVVLTAGEIQPLESLHPVGVIAGYAGREPWLTGGQPITVHDRRYIKVGGERRIPFESIQQRGEHRAIPLFTDPQDATPPQAVYVPLRPGCVFQAYVREDLMRR